MTDVIRTKSQPDPDKIGPFALKVWKYKEGEVLSLMIHLGDRLGLYRALAGAGPVTSADLAAQTGLMERWLLEWLRSQAAAGLIESPDGLTFELGPEAEAVLVDEEGSLWFAAGAFHGGVAAPDVIDRLADAFRTGAGLSYDDQGPSAAHRVERMLGPWTRLALVPRILPALDGVVERLEDGAHVADIGCGAGVAVLTLAEAFPASTFEGHDISHHAIGRARAKLATASFPNVRFELTDAAELAPGARYDFVLTLDCIHDMPHPAAAIAAIRRAIKPDGTWLIKDIKSGTSWASNQRNPMLAMMYGTSVASCMSSALSAPDGAGLGTLGFGPGVAEQMVREAGFTRFTIHDVDDPANLYYEVRP